MGLKKMLKKNYKIKKIADPTQGCSELDFLFTVAVRACVHERWMLLVNKTPLVASSGPATVSCGPVFVTEQLSAQNRQHI